MATQYFYNPQLQKSFALEDVTQNVPVSAGGTGKDFIQKQVKEISNIPTGTGFLTYNDPSFDINKIAQTYRASIGGTAPRTQLEVQTGSTPTVSGFQQLQERPIAFGQTYTPPPISSAQYEQAREAIKTGQLSPAQALQSLQSQVQSGQFSGTVDTSSLFAPLTGIKQGSDVFEFSKDATGNLIKSTPSIQTTKVTPQGISTGANINPADINTTNIDAYLSLVGAGAGTAQGLKTRLQTNGKLTAQDLIDFGVTLGSTTPFKADTSGISDTISSDLITRLSGAPTTSTTQDRVLKAQQDLSSLVTQILSRVNASQREQDLAKQIQQSQLEGVQRQTAIGGQTIPLDIIGAQKQNVAENLAQRVLPLQAELQGLQQARASEYSALEKAYGFAQDAIQQLVKASTPDTQIITTTDASGNQIATTLDKNTGAVLNRISLGQAQASTKSPYIKTLTETDPVTGAKIFYGLKEDETIEKIQITEGGKVIGGVLSTLPTGIQTRLIGIADGFGSKDIVKKFNATVDSINIVNGISANTQNPADHQTIVYAFAKSLDPESVVREGEYATIKKYAQSLLNRFGNEVENAIAGTGFLSAKAISDIKKTMNNNFDSRKPAYESLYSQTSGIINNIAGKDVAGDILIDYSKTLSKTGGESETVTIIKPDGTTGTIPRTSLNKALQLGAKLK